MYSRSNKRENRIENVLLCVFSEVLYVHWIIQARFSIYKVLVFFFPQPPVFFRLLLSLFVRLLFFAALLLFWEEESFFSSLKDFHFLEMDTSIHYLKSMTLLFRFLLLFLTNYDEKFDKTLFNLQPFKFYHHQGVCYTPAVHAFKTCFLLQRLKSLQFSEFSEELKAEE